MATPAKITRARSVLAVKNLETSARYFIDVLGFQDENIEATGWRFLARDGFSLMLGECVDALWAHETGDHSWFVTLYVENIDALHAEINGRSAAPIAAPKDKPWGLREFLVTTPDGHRILFAEVLAR